MTTFTTENYQDIVDILEISPDYLEENSDLRHRGQYLENQDTRLSTTNVDKVIQAITDYKSAKSAYDTAIEGDTMLGVSSQSVPGEYSVSWANGSAGSAKYNNYLIAMRRNRTLIIQYLRWNKTSPYCGTVVRTIS